MDENASGAGRAAAPSLANRQAAAAAYFLVALSGFLVLAWKRDSSFVRFHALQSIVASLAFLAVGILLRLLGFFPIIGFLYDYLLRIYLLAIFFLWLWVMLRAYRGDRYRIPYIGRVVERQIT